jgi:TetR/AcrR family transcriptional repressor of nem operon
MRKSKDETAATRVRIVETAAREFRRNGIHETGLADVMAAAGLTHGGFYRHFDSKDGLVAAACAAAADGLTTMMAKATDAQRGRARAQAVAKRYLSKAHRDAPGDGCPLAALGSEIARSDRATREAATRGFSRLVEIWSGQGGDSEADTTRAKATVAVCAMVGALTLSRIVVDPKVSADILTQTREHLEKL